MVLSLQRFLFYLSDHHLCIDRPLHRQQVLRRRSDHGRMGCREYDHPACRQGDTVPFLFSKACPKACKGHLCDRSCRSLRCGDRLLRARSIEHDNRRSHLDPRTVLRPCKSRRIYRPADCGFGIEREKGRSPRRVLGSPFAATHSGARISGARVKSPLRYPDPLRPCPGRDHA